MICWAYLKWKIMKLANCNEHHGRDDTSLSCWKLRHADGRAATQDEVWGEIERLRSAIKQTLDENGHLADGENCTLIVLKRALTPNGQS